MKEIAMSPTKARDAATALIDCMAWGGLIFNLSL
jgi:hypothetical protein